MHGLEPLYPQSHYDKSTAIIPFPSDRIVYRVGQGITNGHNYLNFSF